MLAPTSFRASKALDTSKGRTNSVFSIAQSTIETTIVV